MLKGFFLYYILTALTHNPLLSLVLLFVLYAVADRAYIGFLPDFFAPLKRSRQIKSLLADLALNPANAAAAQELGILFFEKKKYHKALEFLNKAGEKIHNSGRLYLYLGMTCLELNRPEDGKEALEKAVETDRKAGYGLPYIYLIRYELSRPDPNEVELDKLEADLQRFPSTENFFRLGMVYKNHGRHQKAQAMFRHALEEYASVPRGLRRLHRRWAILSRLHGG